MKDLIIPENIKVSKAEDNSDSYMKRMRLTFKNGYGISIIIGVGSFGGDKGLYEIAPLDKSGGLNGELLGFTDSVEGYLTKEDVLKYCEILAAL